MSPASTVAPRDFWKSAGFHLTHRDKDGFLAVTADFLRAYYTRPEIHPIEESGDAEHRLFERLMEDPFRPVAEAEIAAIASKDAAENYRLVLAYRDSLVAAGSLEAAYLSLFRAGAISIPPVFIDQLVHLILRNVLDGESNPFRLKAAEFFFRDQSVSTDDGQILLADAEIVEMLSETGGLGGLGSLLAEAGTPLRDVTLDVMTEENQDEYWERSDRFDMAGDFRFTQPLQDAFARVVESWVEHFTGIGVRVQPMQSIRDERWSWHIGLDATATGILNRLYAGEAVPDEETGRFMALFRLESLDRSAFIPAMRGKPVYLGLAMTPQRLLKMKPQNLLVNLPTPASGS
ncbi:MAG: DUF6352 family protein [Propylenella sp.]